VSGKRLVHYPNCYGCGSANSVGLQLDVSWDGSTASATFVPPATHEGGPGIAHGGFLGGVVDEVMALTAFEAAQAPAMTRRLEIDYRAPTLTGRPLTLSAHAVEEGERKVIVEMVATAEEGHVCFEARGVYVKVPIDAWATQMVEEQGRSTRELDFAGGDPSNYFRWQLQGVREGFRRDRLSRPLTVVLDVCDVDPSVWTIRLDDAAHVDEGDSDAADVRVVGDFAAVQALWDLSTPANRIVADGLAEVNGDVELLEDFRNALTIPEPKA
jgi:acyl-coenzyme A thioesterase PaaI-like protein